MEERKDRDLGSIFNAKSLLDGQGTRQRDTAQSRKVALDFAGVLDKAGTSEGAKKGWETRRGGGAGQPSEEPGLAGLKGVSSEKANKIGEALDDLSSSLKFVDDQIYAASRLSPREARGYRDEAADEHPMVQAISGIKDAMAETGNLLDSIKEHADQKAWSSFSDRLKKIEDSTVHLGVEEGHERVMADLLGALHRDIASHIEGEDKSKSLTKGGTSEGAKRGWETRRGGGATLVEERAFARVDEAQSAMSRADRELDGLRERLREVMRDPEDRKRMGPGVEAEVRRKESERLDAASSAVKVAAEALSDVKGRPGVDEGKRKAIEDSLGRFRVSVEEDEFDEARVAVEAASRFLEPEPEGAKGGKTYEVVHRPGGKGTFGEVRRVTVPPREDEPAKTMKGSFLTEGE